MKKIVAFILVVCISLGLIGCNGVDETPRDADCQPLEYEIMDENDVSQKIKEKMFEKQKDSYFFTYSDGNEMYIAIGYGEKPTGGYSIKIESVDLCGEVIIVKTELIEPSKEDVVATAITYPSIILKVADMGDEIDVEVHSTK
ncbi:protease complex subunit PrcB family protein [Vallitalea okinawensis]|uniref:protease complex subunit PrcB family protein n=1 Tax=Vallitalea okinawensis TaxID=2078660 RepID=UPI000CFD6C20|nr:protease complex subunit PrcB family protein [Vallitalea okinawensis]